MPNGLGGMEEAGVQAVIRGLGEFKAGAGEMDRAIQGIGDSAGAAQQPVGGLRAHLDQMAQSAGSATIVFGGLAAGATVLIGKLFMAAARTHELDATLKIVGKTAGYTEEQLAGYVKTLTGMNISQQEARTTLIRLIQSEIDLADATKLAAAAQDLGRIAQMTGSDALAIMTDAISSQNMVLLKQFGLTKGLNDIFKEYGSTQVQVSQTTVDHSEKMNTLAKDIEILTAEIQLNNEELALQIGYWGESDNRVRKHQIQIDKLNQRLAKMTGQYNELAGEHGRVITTTKELSKEMTAQEKKQAMINYILAEGEKVAGVYQGTLDEVMGQIRTIPRLLEDLASAFGDYFLEPLGPCVKMVTDLLKGLYALPEATKQVVAAFLMIGTTSAGAVAQLAAMFKIAPLLGGALSFLISPLGLLAAAVGALAGAFIMDVGGIRTKTMPILEAIASVLKDKLAVAIDKVMEVVRPFIRGLQFLASGEIDRGLLNLAVAIDKIFGFDVSLAFLGAMREIEPLIQGVMEAMRPFMVALQYLISGEPDRALLNLAVAIEKVFGFDISLAFLEQMRGIQAWLQENIPLALANLQAIWNEVWPQIQAVVTGVLAGVVDTIKTAWTTIRTWTEKNWPTIRAAIFAVVDWIRSFIELTISNVVAIFGSAWNIIRQWTEENWPLIQATIETILTYIMNIVSYVLRIITVFWEKWGQDLLSIAQTAWNIIKTAIETIIRAILGIIKAVMLLIQGEWRQAGEELLNVAKIIWEGIKEIVSLAIEKIRELVPRMLEAGKALIRGLLDGMKEKADDIIDWIYRLLNRIKSAIKNFFGFSCPEPSRLMAEYGRSIMAGFIQGLEQMRPALESQIAMSLAPVMQVAAPARAPVASPIIVQGGYTWAPQLTAHYAQTQSPASIMDDLQALEMLQGARR